MMMSKTKFVSAIAVASMLVACGGSTPPPKAPVKEAPKKPLAPPKNNLEAGNRAFTSGKFDQALKLYDAHLQRNPDDKTARYNRAVALHQLKRFDEAEMEYEKVLNDDPKHAEATINLGAVLKSQEKIDDAINLYKRYLRDDPYNSRVLNNLATLYRVRKDYSKAIRSVRKLLMRDQNNIDAYKNLALVYYDQKKYKLTQTILANAATMAKEAGKKDADIPVNLGLTWLALGDNGRAMAAFKQAASIDEKHPLANYNIGALALAHRDYGLAAKSFEVAKNEWPKDFEVVASLGFSYQGLQQYPEAEKYLKEANSMEENENVLLQLMIVLQAQEKTDEALAIGERLLQLKGMTCGSEDFEGLCGRYNGIKLMQQMANEPEPAEEEAPKATGQDIFEEGGEEEAAAAEAELEGEGAGENAPAEEGEE